MSSCNVCGDPVDAQYRRTKLQTLCSFCNGRTPPKVSRETFDEKYWGNGHAAEVPESTKREFYSDYLASSSNLSNYIKETTFEA